MKNLFAGSLFALFVLSGINAVSQNQSNLLNGQLSGSYENYSQLYMEDTSIGAFMPPDAFGLNSFFKLDYNISRFSAGLQFESYLPAILGYFPLELPPASKIINKYFKYTGEKFSIQIGDFYEQFGSGLVFRSFENRQIGINNAIEGAHFYVEPTDYLKMKVIYGRPRRLLTYEESIVRGADFELDLNGAFGKKESDLNMVLAGSYLGKYQDYTGPVDNFPTTVNALSGRYLISNADFSLEAEYVFKSPDPSLFNNYNINANGNAFQLDGSYTKNNFGATATYRTLYNMSFQADRGEEFITLAPINYIPALTKQLDYLTSNIYVYAAQFRGESGFQTDVFYNFPAGTKLGGKYGTKVAANFSRYTGLDSSNKLFSSGEKYYSDFNIEIKKKWSKKLETTFAYQNLFYNASVIRSSGEENVAANVIVLGALYKWAPQKSIRVKLEHLGTQTDQGSWAAGVAEVSFSSPWLFFVSDLYNYGETGIHYYNFGASYSRKASRLSLSFGKQRPGLFCAGGVCRFVPAAYGFTLSYTTSFSN